MPPLVGRTNGIWKLLQSACATSLGLAVSVGMLTIVEVALRASDAARGLPLNGPRDGQQYTWGHLVRYNALHFREREVTLPKPRAVYRIMVLGDSLTWGAGLSEGDRYTNQLERLLKEAYSEKRIEVLNFGVSGGPTVLERDILRRLKDHVRPDLIVVGFCLNDLQPSDTDYSIEREHFRARHDNTITTVVGGMESVGLKKLGGALRAAVYAAAELSGKIPNWRVALQRAYEPESEEWRTFVQALRDIRSMSDEMGLGPPIFAVLNQGTYADRPTDYGRPDDYLRDYLRWYAQAERAAGDAGFETVNVEPELATSYRHKRMSVNVVDAHPNAGVHGIYAAKLFGVIGARFDRAQAGGARER